MTGTLPTLSVHLTACACHPDARLHQKPAGLTDLPESLLAGIACYFRVKAQTNSQRLAGEQFSAMVALRQQADRPILNTLVLPAPRPGIRRHLRAHRLPALRGPPVARPGQRP